MGNRLRSIWQGLNASYWFYPALFALGALVLSLVTVELDRGGWAERMVGLAWLYPAQPSGASNMLTVIAGSMIGVASTVFSITIAAVVYASGTYGPRLLTNFLENRGNQLSLASFIGTFVYALGVLRTVRSEGEGVDGLDGAFVPQLSLLFAYALMAVSIAVLVYFLNHIPASIRVNSVLQEIGERLAGDIRNRFPQPAGTMEVRQTEDGEPITASRTGYVQQIAFDALEAIGSEASATIHLAVRAGDFVHSQVPLARWSGDTPPTEGQLARFLGAFTLGGMRTPVQDLHFLIDELVEIGLRALSPGINDPFTAITALHWLGAATAELAGRDLAADSLADPDGDMRHVCLLSDDFAHYLQRGFGAMRSAVATSPTAAMVAFESMAHAAGACPAGRRDTIRAEGERLIAQARTALAGPDLAQVEQAYAGFVERLSVAS